MNVLDAGHCYELANYDGPGSVTLTFVKRVGVGYPGNFGAHSGTLSQEVLRVLILLLFEERAAERHGQVFAKPFAEVEIEKYDPSANGHLTEFWRAP